MLLVCLVLIASFMWFLISFDKDYQPSTDFDETESHLMVWSPVYVNTYLNFIKNLAEDDHVILFVPSSIKYDSVINELKLFGVNLNNIQIQTISNADIWIRDYGPSFLQNKNGKFKTLSFNYHNLKRHSFAYEYQYLFKEKLRASKLVSIGGARELNGEGLAILVEKHETHNNPKLTKKEIGKELKKKLGVKKIIWLKSGLPQDELRAATPLLDSIYTSGAGNHIDAFCRFISPNTVLLAKVNSNEINANPVMKIAHDRLEENYNILKNASDQDGNPLNIIRVPMAPLLFEMEYHNNKPKTFLRSTSYLNFIITKNKVIIPSYAQYLKNQEAVAKDFEAEIIFRSIFPDKKIVLLDCVELNRNGGGFHCIAINKPKKKKRKKVA